ncbi:hypothetical protein A3D77_02630 [Candidatus Gottesmanbacteria bacterium RIFCSPHIGHO2_02_FULL_39_11]|uniref:Zinc finger DksA/TraR C4-type domain-containing protein n=1 Tax=Candidatus Gottesmanbacteria bacterium RIFCSPHIGHO2_02_FULL_39_11 TaxID=1798382 RepID=A0A1F5ZSZ0_9BACT|nr:MAG: hypothetical protein A3D77_02630 [Candidatus Gottesmanbacteria bacterium RIFCSPHIGHO2_02_FULL_39_11]
MNSLNADITKQMKKRLLDEKEKLLQTLSSLKAQDPFANTDRLNDNAASDTEAKEETDHERYEAIISQQRKRMSEIELALKRIEDTTYGICLNCGKPIEQKRLLVNPAAVYCLTCEKNLEK